MLLILLIYYYTNAGRGEIGIQHHVYPTKKIQTLVFINLSYLLTYRTVLFPAFFYLAANNCSSVYYLFFVFIYYYFILHVFMYMCIWCSHICAHIGQPEVDARYLPQLLSIPRQSCSLESRAH